MQALEEEFTTLRRAIRHWLNRMVGRRDTRSLASKSLAHDMGLPPDVVSGILDRTAAELRKLSVSDDSGDARAIIDRAASELAKVGTRSQAFEEATLDSYLGELPDRDYDILRHFKQGRKHGEIATLMGTDVESVRRSLVKTYADLRMRMISCNGGDGDTIPASDRQRLRNHGRH